MAAMKPLDIAVARKAYRKAGADNVALADLSFAVPPGQFLCIVGPSGCGKTTLLSIMAGLDRDFEGRVGGGADARMGFVFQTPRLMPWLSARDNVRLALEPPPRQEGRAEALLRDMNLGDQLDSYPGHLSGGQQRRVALARAFVNQPELLLLDEPFTSLDAPTAQQLRDLLLALWQRQRPTVLFVTHDLREALSLGDRVLFMSAAPGRIVLDLPVELPRPRLYEGPALDAVRRRLLDLYPDLLRGLDRRKSAEDAA
jgi:NitT/TauT family transport system ATP-binding protein